MTDVVTLSADSVQNRRVLIHPPTRLETKRMSSLETAGKESCECPECEYTSDSQHGIKIHYGIVHEGTLQPEIVCEWCEGTFHVKPKREDSARFCSQTCHRNWLCGGERPSAEKLRELHRDRAMSLNEMAEHFGVGGHQTIARWFERYGIEYRSNGEANRKLAADRDSYEELVRPAHEAVSEAVQNGEWHLQTESPERNGYGEGWTEEKRETVRELYGRVCQACGMGEDESKERFGTRLDVHHITPWSRFDDAEKRNAVENLVPLCRSCHQKWEGIPLRPEVVA